MWPLRQSGHAEMANGERGRMALTQSNIRYPPFRPPSSRQRRQDPRPAADPLVEAFEIELLVGRMHAVVIEREADHQRIHAEHALEVADDRDRTAGADRHRLLAPLVGE